MGETITGNFTCDNVYAIYIGDGSAVTRRILPESTSSNLAVVNNSAGEIYSGDNVTFDVEPGEFFYLIAWSDNSGKQGLIGEFSGSQTVKTGDPQWRVLPTKRDAGIPAATHPDMAEINTYIASAQSADWKTPTSNFTNLETGQIYNGWNKIAIISDDARWTWYDSGNDSNSMAPYSGFNHDEFLIFRIPVAEFGVTEPEPPLEEDKKDCCVNVNLNTCCEGEKDTKVRYDVTMTRVKLLKNAAFDGKAELMITGYANGKTAVFPGMATYFNLLKKWGWTNINQLITTVAVEKGEKYFVPVMADCIEVDIAAAGSWEMGSSQSVKYLEIETGKPVKAVTQKVQFRKVKNNALGEIAGEIEIEFLAYPSQE